MPVQISLYCFLIWCRWCIWTAFTAACGWWRRSSSRASSGWGRRRFVMACDTSLSSLCIAVHNQWISTFSLVISSFTWQNLKNLAVASRIAGLTQRRSQMSSCVCRSRSNSPKNVYWVMSFHEMGAHGGWSAAAWMLYWVIAFRMASDLRWRPLLICWQSLYPVILHEHDYRSR